MTTENIDFILLIMNCQKYRYKAEKQRETWLKNIQIPYYHVLANENLHSAFFFDKDAKVLWVKTPDDYTSLPKKVIASYAAVMQTYNPSYIFKTDDDQFLLYNDSTKFFKSLSNIIQTKTQKVHYAGHIVDVTQSYLSKYHLIHPELPEYLPVYATKYCSGRFYALSREAVYALMLKKKEFEKEYLEDYAVGFLLNSELKTDMLHIQSSKYFQDV